MSIQRDECCIANPTRNIALSKNVVRLRLRLPTYIESEQQRYGISNTVSTIYTSF
jgi:hypothetical protein